MSWADKLIRGAARARLANCYLQLRAASSQLPADAERPPEQVAAEVVYRNVERRLAQAGDEQVDPGGELDVAFELSSEQAERDAAQWFLRVAHEHQRF